MSGKYREAFQKVEKLRPGNPDIPPKEVFSTAAPYCDKIKTRSMDELERVWLPKELVKLYKEKMRKWCLPLKRHIVERVHSLCEGELEECLDEARTPKERMEILFAQTCTESILEWKLIARYDGDFSVNGKRHFYYFIYEPTDGFDNPAIYIVPKKEEDLRKMPDYAASYDLGMAFAYWQICDGTLRLNVVQSDVYGHIPAGIRKHYRHWPDAIFGIAAMLAKDYGEKYVSVVPAFLPLNLWPSLSVSNAHFVYSYKPSKYFELDLDSGFWVAKPDEILEKMRKQ